MRLYYDSTPTEFDPTWVRVSAIVDFPEISSRNNMHGLCTVTLRDFEGALYATWNSRDLIRMLVTDDADADVANCNVIFRGILINKSFHDRDLVLEIGGIGIELRRRSFYSEIEKNYILANGFVKTLDANSRIHLQYKDTDDVFQDFTWTLDEWIDNERDVGLMIKDTTQGYGTQTWDADDPLVLTGDTARATETGDYSDTLVFQDGNYYVCKVAPPDLLVHNIDVVLTPTINGAVIDGTDPGKQPLKSITIEWNFKMGMFVYGFPTPHYVSTIQLQILKDETWEDIPGAYKRMDEIVGGLYSSEWCQGVSIAEGGEGGEYPIVGTDEDLQNYFNKVGGNYNELKGLRFKFETDAIYCYDNSWVKFTLDFLKVTPKFHTYDIDPIMYKITDNGASWVECSGVSNWQQMGVTVDEDAFQIGENTRKIVQDVASNAGIEIDIITNTLEEGAVDYIVPNASIQQNWDPGLGSQWNRLDEYPDVDGDGAYISASFGDAGKIDEWNFTTLPNIQEIEITQIDLYVYVKRVNIGDVNLTWDIDLGGYQGSKTCTMTNGAYGWETMQWADLSGDQDDLNDFKVKVTAPPAILAGEVCYIETVYVKLTYNHIPHWTKYMARKFKGQHCSNVLKSVLKLEGAEWMEDYSNNRLKLIKKKDFDSSGVSITQADYDHSWEYEDQCNQVKYVYVWGKTSFNNVSKTTTNIFAKAIDTSVTGEKSMQIIDDNIYTVVEAQLLANEQLALLKDKRPSIRIPLNGINEDLELGTTVNVTMARPTVGAADYPVRMIQRSKRGKTGINTIVYAGFGETDWDEKITKQILQNTSLAQKSLTDRLNSTPYDVGVGGVNWADVSGRDAGVELIITAELVNGQSIDNRIDALLTANADGYTTNALAHAYVEANQLTMSQDIIFHGGQTFDGKDVSTLGTDAEAHAYVEANALTITGGIQMSGVNITMAGGELVDGKDVSTLCTTAQAHAYIEDTPLTMTQVITFDAAQTFDGKDVSGLCTEAEAHAYVEATALTLTQNLVLADAKELCLGTDSDMKFGVFQAVPNHYIRCYRHGGTFELGGEDIGGVMRDILTADPDTFTKIFYHGTEKLATTNTGIEVAGNIVVSGTVDGVDILARDHAPTVAGDLNHNDLANLNAGDAYEHITQAQKNALHATYTNAEAVAAVLADDAYVKNTGDAMTGELAMGANKITGLAAAANNGEAVRYEQLNTRLHAITDVLDHSANNHKIFYSDGAGHVIELAIGADDLVLKSNGPAAAPSWQSDNAGEAGDKTRAINMTLQNNPTINTWVDYGIINTFYGHGVFAVVRVPDNMDTNSDCYIVEQWICREAEAVSARRRWCEIIETDGSEATSWNVINGEQYNARSGAAEVINRAYQEIHTISAADIAPNNEIVFYMRSNESGMTIEWRSFTLIYEVN